MKTRITGLLCGGLLAVACVCKGQTPAAQLLDEIIGAPGHWDQMCSSPPPIPYDVPLPLYRLEARRVFTLSETNIAKLKAQRAEVVAEIGRRLEKIDLSKKPVKQNSSFRYSGQDPYALSGLMLEVVLELNAVELVPGLLRVEDDLNRRMEAAEKDTAAPVPQLDIDGPAQWPNADYKSADYPRQRAMFIARIYQREMLAVVAALLRNEKFQPLMASDMEKRYQELQTRDAASQQIGSRAAAKDYHVAYTPELRAQIRQFAMDYAKQSSGAAVKSVADKSK